MLISLLGDLAGLIASDGYPAGGRIAGSNMGAAPGRVLHARLLRCVCVCFCFCPAATAHIWVLQDVFARGAYPRSQGAAQAYASPAYLVREYVRLFLVSACLIAHPMCSIPSDGQYISSSSTSLLLSCPSDPSAPT